MLMLYFNWKGWKLAMSLDYSIIGERLKKARIDKSLTQEQLAEKMDVSVAFK